MKKTNQTKGIEIKEKIARSIIKCSTKFIEYQIRENDKNLNVDLVIDEFRRGKRTNTYKIEIRSMNLFYKVKKRDDYRLNSYDLRRIEPCDLIIFVLTLRPHKQILLTLPIPYVVLEKTILERSRIALYELLYDTFKQNGNKTKRGLKHGKKGEIE
jgi:hypothetical protein